jgi:hypothetical protein
MNFADITDNQPTVFDPAARFSGIYSFMDHKGRSFWGGETLEELKASGAVSAEAVTLPWDQAWKLEEQRQRRQYCRGPQRITRETFDEALNCLPPERWMQTSNYESFRLSEMLCGTIASFYVRVGQSYWTLNEERQTTHEELIRQVVAVVAAAHEVTA